MQSTLDELISERAPWLYAGRPGTRVVRSAINHMLGYKKTVRLATALKDLPATQLMSMVAEMLSQKISVSGAANIPLTGPGLVVANHPTGIADGIILYKLLVMRRPDLFFYANNDILRVFPQLSEMIVPVEWRLEKRSHAKTRETMAMTREAIDAEKLGVIFPSGRLAKRHGLHLHERPWMASAAMIARRFDLPIIPVRIEARNSALFYGLDALHPTLRDITLFHETLNKDRQTFDVAIGRPITPSDLPKSSDAAITLLKEKTLSIGGKPEALPLLPGRSVARGRSTRLWGKTWPNRA